MKRVKVLEKFEYKFSALIDFLIKKLPMNVTGNKNTLEKHFYKIDGAGNYEEDIWESQKKNGKRYLLVGLIGALVISFVSVDYFTKEAIIKLDSQRNQYYIERNEKVIKRVPVVLYGKIDGKGKTENTKITIQPIKSIKEENDKIKDKKNNFKREVSYLVYNLNNDISGNKVYLPKSTEKIKNIVWKEDNQNVIPLLLVIWLVIFLMVYMSRYDEIKKVDREMMNSIDEELPNFINKIVLYMSAGLVLSTALKKVIEEKSKEKSYFYQQLNKIQEKANLTNSSIVPEIRNFALRCENRQMLRTIGVIEDNLNKGTELVSVLKEESKLLWFYRKKNAEEKGKIIETKLNMPIALQLLVLIIITVAPAMLDV